nr:retrovirus-related Pol polyprotein from transposon TNT 1-94 [Tanacetum cinerariifolium]
MNDVVSLQALIDRRKVIITEASVRQALRLDDAENVDCLPNEEIFTELARMGDEKPSTKLTFYKAFFSTQWKFLIHTILQCISAKRTVWNEFNSSMASAVICLATGRKFNSLKYIFDSLVRDVDSSSKFYMYPRFLQLMINAQIAYLTSHNTKYTSPTLTQKVFANMRRVGKGFFGVDTPLFEGMLVPQQVPDDARRVNGLIKCKLTGHVFRAKAQSTTTSITTYLLKILHHCHFIIHQSFIMTTPTLTSSTDSQMHNNIKAVGSRDRPPMLETGRYPQRRLRFLRCIDTRPNGEALRKCILSGPYKPTTVLVQVVEATDDSPAIPEHTTTNLFWEFGKFTSHDGETMESYYTRFYKLMNEMIRNNLTVTTMQVNVQFLQQLQPEWSRFVTIVKQQHKLDEVSYHKLFDILKQYQNEVNELCAERRARNANPLALVATTQANQDPYYQTSRSHKSHAPSSKPLILTRSHTSTRHKGKEIAKPIIPPSETASEKDSDPEQAQRDKDMQKNLALISKYFKKIYKPTNNNLRTSLNFKNKNVDTTPRYKNDDHSGQFRNQRTVNVVGAREKVGSPVVQQSRIQCFNCKEFGHFAKECRNPKRVKDSAYHKEKMLLCKQAEQGVPLQAEHNTWLVEADDSNVIPDSPDMCEDDIQNDQNDVESDDERVAIANLIANLKLDKTKVITDLKLREEHDIDKMISMEKQLKFLNEIIYKRSQSIQTIHMIAPKVPTYNGRPTFANPRYLKQAQSEILCLYEFLYDQSTHANRLIPDGEETLALERESRSKLNKDLARPYDYTTHNSLYEIFKPPTQEYEIQLAHANEIKRKMWRKSFMKSKPNIYKNVRFLPVSKSISKTRQAYNVMTNNINHFKEIVDNAWIKYSKDQFRAPTVQDIEILIQTCLKPLAIKTQNDCFKFVHELKQEMHADLKYVESLEKEIDKLESNKAEFSDMYDVILQECVKECDCLAQKLSKQTKSVKNDIVCNEKASNVFRKEREQYFKIQDLRAQMQEKNISISELKKLIKKGKEKSVDTKFDRTSVVRQPNAQRIPKPSVLGKPTPFSNSLERIYFPKTMSVSKVNFAPILGYGDLVKGNVMINKVYYVEGLNRNLFSVGQFWDADLEVAFRKSTCFVRDLQGNDLLNGNRGSDLYTISLQESTSLTPLCLMAKASPTQAWLWHRRLSHLNFDYINLLSKKDIMIGLPKLKYVKDQLCSSCELSKAKRSSFKSKVIQSLKGRLNLLHIDLCGPMRVASINGKKYILVIVDDYSRYTGIEFLTKTLNAFFKEEGIEHQTFTARTPKQNSVVER